MMDIPKDAFALSIEQRFMLSASAIQLESMSHAQKNEIILSLTSQLIVKDNIIKHLVADKIASGFKQHIEQGHKQC